MVKYLDQIIFNPEMDGFDGTVNVFVFKDDFLETESFGVSLSKIKVEQARDGFAETRVRFECLQNPNSLMRRIAEKATILTPRPEDVGAW